MSCQQRGRWVDLHPEDVNARIRDLTGSPAAKDFRTWNATVLASVALAAWPAAKIRTGRQKAIRRAVYEVSEYLGNTPAVCRRSYIDPRVVDLFHDGITIRRSLGWLGAERDAVLAIHGAAEQAVIRLLRWYRDIER